MTNTWWDKNISNFKTYIRSYGEGVGTASRNWLLTVVRDGESLLDVGCGPGCTYESFKVNERDIIYRGADYCQGFIDGCRELFPEADFKLESAMDLQEEDNSWDNVLLRHIIEHVPDYNIAIKEAYRVARKRVIIVTWRPLYDKPTKLKDLGDEGYCADINAKEFMQTIGQFVRPVTYHNFPGGRENWAWAIYKIVDDCVFDLDDFWGEDDSNHSPGFDLLFDLKETFPKMKVTLFTIPAKSYRGWLREVAKHDWIELAIHGWSHEPNTECREWTYEETCVYIKEAESMGCFVKGFRPPGWAISEEAIQALEDNGYWVAVSWRDRAKLKGHNIPAYMISGDDNRSVHGHMQEIRSNNPYLRNGLVQLVNERGMPWDQDTEFHFVSEVVE